MMLCRRMLCCLLLVLVAAGAKPTSKARVSFELVTEQGFPIDGAQKWYELFTELGVSGLRIRGATGRDEVVLEKIGDKNPPVYQVTGRLTATNVLQLPGGKFTLSDGARIKKWIDDLSDQGIEGVTQARSAFGMTAMQLQDVNQDLRKPIKLSTKDLAAREAVEKVGRDLQFRLELDADAKQALGNVKVAEDLAGISSGTALAMMLRPAGLVLTPEQPRGSEIRYRVAKPVPGRESWPIGWKPEAQERKLVPKLFDFINVEIEETPVTEALEAIQERLKIPFVWDHNAMALQGIEPGKVQVKLPAKKLTYSLIMQRVLSQAKLKKELRIDEAGKPFLWITTIKSETGGARK